ncbi:TetR/AcrR family transcriptional regulator [Speluncibacter jeojiensis]|uniref:TetR/AcrR family transcriptional regulator n=1 Tax=Speluncibacter jeojiensis TaxID=2710754 RepID=A0A9X4M303_9ACTN|nr:TetR/AcrR family transcriptional regulator [Corynebacteriales bacterium D3-21]
MCRPRRRLAPEQRRAQLLDIGARLFAERPYEEVWIEEVAEEAGVSRGLMYHYFPTKRDFFAAIVRRSSEQLLAATEPDPQLPVTGQLAAGLDAYIAHFAEHEHGVRAVNQGALSADPGIRDIVDAQIGMQERRIVEALGLGGDAAEVSGVAVRGWLVFVRTVCLDWLDHRTVTPEQLRQLCLRTLAGALGVGEPGLGAAGTDAGRP